MATTTSESTWGEHSEPLVNYVLDAAANGSMMEFQRWRFQGRSLECHDTGGRTMLMAAVGRNLEELVEQLIQWDANVNARDDKLGATPLMRAAAVGNAPITRLLLNAGANPGLATTEVEARTARELAIEAGHSEVASIIETEEEERRAAFSAPPRATEAERSIGQMSVLRLAGNSRFAASDWESAAEAYGEALAAAADHPKCAKEAVRCYSNRAACFLQMGRARQARDDARRAIALDPSYGKAHHRLSKALEAMGDKDGAAEAMKRATELAPTLPPSPEATPPSGFDRAEAAERPAARPVERPAERPAEPPAGPPAEPPAGPPVERPSEAAGDVAMADAQTDPAERVAEICEGLGATQAGSDERRDAVAELLQLLRAASEAPKAEQWAVARSFVDSDGPATLYSIESCMQGDWMADARNGTLQKVSMVRRLPGPIGQSLASYRQVAEMNKTSAAEGKCDH